MSTKKCDRIHKGKRCQNPGVWFSEIKLVNLANGVAIVCVNQCEDHGDYPEQEMEKWAEAKWERQNMDQKKKISPINIV